MTQQVLFFKTKSKKLRKKIIEGTKNSWLGTKKSQKDMVDVFK